MRPQRCGYVVAGCFVLVALVAAFITPHQATGADRPRPSAAFAPVRRIGRPGPLVRGPNASQGTSVTATNWAGYDVTDAGLSSVTATWTQPFAQSTSPPDSDAAFWVGLDGDGSSSVEQTGTEAYMEDGSIHYDAWYEMYPAAEVTITSLTISPGDQMTGTVTSNGSGGFTLTLVDDTTHASFSTSKSNGVVAPASAEVIAEAPTDAETDDLLPLADFGTVDFTSCAFDGQPISAFSWNCIDMVSGEGATWATTSALGSDGASFSVSQPALVDATPPTTTVAGDDAHWHNKAVNLTFKAVDNSGGSGISYTQCRLDGGPWIDATSLTIAAPASHANDGVHTVLYRSADNAGNVEKAKSCTVKIDTRPPRVVANWAAKVNRGHTAGLQYDVSDPRPGSPTATVTIRIRNAANRLAKTLVAKSVAVDERLAARFLCKLAKGRYRFSIYATDAAGNPQKKVGSNSLTVR